MLMKIETYPEGASEPVDIYINSAHIEQIIDQSDGRSMVAFTSGHTATANMTSDAVVTLIQRLPR